MPHSETGTSVAKHITDVAAAASTAGVLMQWIPPLAGLLTILWTLLRLFEMFTGVPVHKTAFAKKLCGIKKEGE
jgi:hypothetical protein